MLANAVHICQAGSTSRLAPLWLVMIVSQAQLFGQTYSALTQTPLLLLPAGLALAAQRLYLPGTLFGYHLSAVAVGSS